MSRGNPQLQVRVPAADLARWKAEAKALGISLGEHVVRRMNVTPGGMSRSEVVEADEPLEPQGTPAAQSPPPNENPLARHVRLKREWEELRIEHPALAREVGDFAEYVRRQEEPAGVSAR
jgi:hypothetical protein